MDLASIDYGFLVREWQELVGARLQKVYGKPGVHALEVYTSTKRTLMVTGDAAFLTDAKLQWPKAPTGYTLFLRRRLQGSRIRAITQAHNDRVILITVENAEGTNTLVLELLGELQSMLLNAEGKIISCLSPRTYGQRTVRGGVVYQPPPIRPAPWDVPQEQLTGKPAAKAFATELGLGGAWAEELCARLSLAKTQPLTAEDVTSAQTLLQELANGPILAVTGGSDARPVPFLTKPLITESAPSYNAALERVLIPALVAASEAAAQATAPETVQQSKHERIMAAQRAQVAKLTQDAAREQRIGELMYEHYTELTALLAALHTDFRKLPLGTVRDKYAAHPLVRKINEDGTIEVELGE